MSKAGELLIVLPWTSILEVDANNPYRLPLDTYVFCGYTVRRGFILVQRIKKIFGPLYITKCAIFIDSADNYRVKGHVSKEHPPEPGTARGDSCPEGTGQGGGRKDTSALEQGGAERGPQEGSAES